MATTYREKLIADINDIPDSKLPQFYKVVHTLKEQFLPLAHKKSTVSRKLGSAKGQVWIADDFNDPLPDEVVDEFYK
jgi:hypothetical protein